MIYKVLERTTYWDSENNQLVTVEKNKFIENLATNILKELLDKKLIEAIPELHEIPVFQIPSEFLTEIEIRKIKSKKELIIYAESIGLENIDASLTMDAICSLIFDRIEVLKNADSNE